VRDYFQHASRAPTISPLERHPVLHEFDGSRIAAAQFRGGLKLLVSYDRVSIRFDNYDRRHRVRWPASQQDNRSRVCKCRPDAGDETCNQRNSDCVDGARERAPIWWRAFEDNGLDSRNHLTCPASIGESELTHFSPLFWKTSWLGKPSPSPLQREKRPTH